LQDYTLIALGKMAPKEEMLAQVNKKKRKKLLLKQSQM
jgi:hypothetical protein